MVVLQTTLLPHVSLAKLTHYLRIFSYLHGDLFRMLNIGHDLGWFKGISVSRPPKITQLNFAADALLFFRSFTQSCTA